MPKTDNITQSRLKELVHYDPNTGLFVWLQRPSPRANRIKVGAVAGYNHDGYRRVTIDNAEYYLHRLAFLYMMGYMPVEVDHNDRNRSNNRWKNLSAIAHLINTKNQTLRSNNTSGVCGVAYDGKKWVARTMANGKNIHLGRFTNKQDAIDAREAADIKYGFHKNHCK